MFEFNPDLVNEGEEIDGDVCDSRLREKEEGDVSYQMSVTLSLKLKSNSLRGSISLFLTHR